MTARGCTRRRARVLPILLATLACATARAERVPRDARILSAAPAIRAGYEHDYDVPACRDFMLSPEQLRVFLREARIVNVMEANEAFDWAPCVVRGEAVSGRERFAFEIGAGLVGTLRFADGRVLWLGCDGQCPSAVFPEDSGGAREGEDAGAE